MYVYLNYPGSRISIHKDPVCRLIQMQNKPNQRMIKINRTNLNDELLNFNRSEIKFDATKECNDLWLVIELGSKDEEMAVVQNLRELIGRKYKRIRNAAIKEHC